MNQNEKLSYLKELFLKTGNLYTWHFTPDMKLISHNCPSGEQVKDILLLSTCYDYMKPYILENDKPVLLYDDLSFLWGVIPAYSKQTVESVYVLGPVCSSHTSDDFIKSKMDTLNMSVKTKRMMLDMLNTIPVIPTLFFTQYNCQFYYTMTGLAISMSDIHYQPTTKVPVSSKSQNSILRHNSYQYECMILEAIEKGDINPDLNLQGLIQCGLMSPGNPLRQKQDEIIVYTALVTRAAIRGGFSPENAYALSDYYIQAIETASDIPEVDQIGKTMHEDFVRHVHDSKQYSIHNALVKKCMDYLDSHLTEHIDLDVLAQELGYTKYYLTRRFKDETGTSISQHILAKRIEYAKNYLMYSRLSILEISKKLQFSSPSHFTYVFRKMTGVTPTEYRQNH